MRVEVGLLTHPFHENPVWPGLDEIARTARDVEEAGFDGILVPEAGGHDPFLPILIAAQTTSRVTFRTGVAVAFPRSPLVMAQTAWDLQRFTGGRFRLGLGTQVKTHNEKRFAAPWAGPPGPRLREYVACMRAMFATFREPSAPKYFEGKYYQFTFMPEMFNPGPIEHTEVPIDLAAVNPYMCRLAGELADGVFPHPICTPRFIREIMQPLVVRGARKAGRDAGTLEVIVSPMVATGRDREEVERKRRYLKQRLGFYASTRRYHGPVEMHGWIDEGMKLFELSKQGRWHDMVPVVSDAMFDDFAVSGVYDEVGPKLRERWEGVADVIHLDLPPELRADRKLVRSLIEALH
jgi:probable F420-dependent oxidoreductase